MMFWKLCPNALFWSLRAAAVRNSRSLRETASSMYWPSVREIVNDSFADNAEPAPAVNAPGGRLVPCAALPSWRKSTYCAPIVVFELSQLRGFHVPVLDTFAVMFFRLVRQLEASPFRYVAVIGGPSPLNRSSFSLRSVRSLPTSARFCIHDVGRQLTLMEPMKRLIPWSSLSWYV